MYYELNLNEQEKIKEISSMTFTDYEIENNKIPVDKLMSALEDLLSEYHHKEDELIELQNEIENNYELKKTDPYEEYGVSQRNFI